MFPDEQVDEHDEESTPEAGSNPLARIVLWLVICSLALMFLPLYLASVSLKEMRPTLEAQLSEVAVTLNTTLEPNSTQQALSDELIAARGQVLVLDSLQGTLTTGYRDWSILMRYIGTFNADQMSLTSVTQSTDSMTLNGKASDEAVVMAYVQHLRENSQFDTVTIQGINTDLTKPTPTPEAGQPGEGTPSGQASGQESMQAVTFTLLVRLAPPATVTPASPETPAQP